MGLEQRRCPPLPAAYLTGPERHPDSGALRFRGLGEGSESGSQRRPPRTLLATRRLIVGGARTHANVYSAKRCSPFGTATALKGKANQKVNLIRGALDQVEIAPEHFRRKVRIAEFRTQAQEQE